MASSILWYRAIDLPRFGAAHCKRSARAKLISLVNARIRCPYFNYWLPAGAKERDSSAVFVLRYIIGTDPAHTSRNMPSVTIRYFASLRERLCRESEVFEFEGIITVSEVFRRATGSAPPATTLVAINQEYAALSATVRAGDEVAFFPPVTGG